MRSDRHPLLRTAMAECGSRYIYRFFDDETGVEAAQLGCDLWRCEYCKPIKISHIRWRIMAGSPERFITFTLRYNPHADPKAEHQRLTKGFNRIAREIRRLYGRDSFEYAWVCELTKKGTPHLHVVQRGKYIPQKVLSRLAEKYLDAPRAYIERVYTREGAAGYLLKYLSKDLQAPAWQRRVTFSRGWQLEQRPPPIFDLSKAAGFRLGEGTFSTFYATHQLQCWWREELSYRHNRFYRPGHALYGVARGPP